MSIPERIAASGIVPVVRIDRPEVEALMGGVSARVRR